MAMMQSTPGMPAMGSTMNPNMSSNTLTPTSNLTGNGMNAGMSNSMTPMQPPNMGLPSIGNQGPVQPFMTNSAFFPKQES